ncbi:hypothetical protein GJ496_000745 [Pomphorhynchus laevis]|nr:hypothetical protein GJ496_000745 [Pomphorhynchus laevis]
MFSCPANIQDTSLRTTSLTESEFGDDRGSIICDRSKKRQPSHRIFANRILHLEKIKFYGFDMDYTLAVYKSPIFEELTCQFVLKKLAELGYPNEITEFKYNPSFPVRGLWFDKQYGNFLNVDSNYNILVCTRGFDVLQRSQINEIYPNAYALFSADRYYVLDSLFHLPVIYILAVLIDYFCKNPNYTIEAHGVTTDNDVYISYEAIFEDVRISTDDIHHEKDMKAIICQDLESYVIASPDIKLMLQSIKQYGARTFLLTNSDYNYTNLMMTYLLGSEPHWKTYFDYIVVDANKPTFFGEGTTLRKIDEGSKKCLVGQYRGPLEKCTVYSGGSCQVFGKLICSKGKDVLYIGDHIYGDIIRSKKQRSWRTFLIIPELEQELHIFHKKRDLFNKVEAQYEQISKQLMKFDITASNQKSDIGKIMNDVFKHTNEMNKQYGILGSLFRKGARQTLFANQVIRYADIYASSATKLLHYPLFYLFRASPMLMPHEATVNPHDPYDELTPYGVRSRTKFDDIKSNLHDSNSNDLCGKEHLASYLNNQSRKQKQINFNRKTDQFVIFQRYNQRSDNLGLEGNEINDQSKYLWHPLSIQKEITPIYDIGINGITIKGNTIALFPNQLKSLISQIQATSTSCFPPSCKLNY